MNRQVMTLDKAKQAIVNGIYAAAAWLLLDLGFLFQAHGMETVSILMSQTELLIGMAASIGCIVGLVYKSRVAAIVLFLLFLVPLLLRMIQGLFPSGMVLIFSLALLYFFLAAVLGTFNYHRLKASDSLGNDTD